MVEALALLSADQVSAGNAVVVKGKLAGVHALVAQLGNVPHHVETGTLLGNEDADATAGRVGLRVGLGYQRERVAVAAVGNEALGAVDDILVAVPDRAGLDGLYVAARVGLGDADAAPLLARCHQGQEVFLLLLGTVSRDHVRHDQVGVEDAAQAHPSPADLLDDQGVG